MAEVGDGAAICGEIWLVYRGFVGFEFRKIYLS